MKVKIKKLHSDAVIPTYAKSGDAGMDLVATKIISNTIVELIQSLSVDEIISLLELVYAESKG